MAVEYFDPLTDSEKNNDTNMFISGAAGIASGLIKVPEGVFSLAAELIDLGFGSDLAAKVEKTFDSIQDFVGAEDLADDTGLGRLTEALVQIGVPGTVGFKLASRAMSAKKAGNALNLKNPNLIRASSRADSLNKKIAMKRFAAGVTGGAAGETFVADVEEIGSFGDIFGGPTALSNEEEETVKGDALRKLMNRVKFGSESLLLTPFVYGVGRGVKSLATGGERAAISNSKFDRAVDKFAGAFRPRRNLPQEVFDSQMYRESLKSSDVHRANELVKNIDVNVNKAFPETQLMFDRSNPKERIELMKKLKSLLLSDDIRGPLNPKLTDDAMRFMKSKGVDKKQRGNVIKALTDARSEFERLLDLTKTNSAPGTIMKENVKDVTQIIGDRIEERIANTYRVFEDKGSAFFRSGYQPANEAYDRVVDIFRRYSRKHAKPNKKGVKEMITLQEGRYMVNNILEETAKRKPKAGDIPSFQYTNLSQGSDGKDMIKNFVRTVDKGKFYRKDGENIIGQGSKAFRDFFGKIEDPRYTIYNGITNISSVARTNQYLLDIAARNETILKSKTPEKAFFQPSKKAAEKATNFNAEIVKLDDVITPMTRNGNLINPLSGMYTTRAIASGIDNINNINGFFAGAVRGVRGRDDASLPEEAVAWGYRNLLMYPKGISQISKTVLSIPTHIRNFISAGAFAGANGIFFQNPKVVKDAFKQAFGTIQVGTRGEAANAAYRELLELGVVNSQVQIGDLKNLLRDVRFGGSIADSDAVLKPMLSKLNVIGKRLKKIGKGFQDAYVAEDDFWKITTYAVELDRLGKGYAKAGIKRTPRQLKEEAANIVKNTVPNYAYVGDIVKTARILPIGNFMSFPSEMIRTTGNIAQQSLKEMGHSKPTSFGTKFSPVVYEIGKGLVENNNPFYGTGWRRLTGLAGVVTVVPPVLVEGAKALYNVSEDELKALRRFVPSWSKNSTILPTRDEDTGELKYIDFSHSNAYDVVGRPVRTLLNRLQEGVDDEKPLLDGLATGIAEASGEIMNPFISESIFTEALLNITTRGGRTSEGKQLYTDQTSFGDKQKIKFLHVGKALSPSFKSYERLIKAGADIPGKRGEDYELSDEIKGFMGFRPIKVDPLNSMGFKISGFQSGIRNARREFTGGPFGVLSGGKVSPDNVIERYLKSNQARFEVQKNMFRDIEAAEILGTDVSDLRKTFRDRQLSPLTFNKLRDAEFIPYYPSLDIQKKFKEIAEKINSLNPFEEAKDVLQELFQEFKEMSLIEQFDIDLNNYLLNPEPLTRAPLPPTPDVNPEMIQPAVQQASLTQTGLTPSEQALLSPEEQAIRLRQRGMA